MANQLHLDILKQGVEVWNKWRREHAEIRPDFSTANLREITLSYADFSYATLQRTDLSGAYLSFAYLRGADLRGANLSSAYLRGAYLGRSDLSSASLMGAVLINTNLEQANLVDCRIYGISAWDVRLEGAIQYNLVITLDNQPTITVDNLKIAQFVYLLLNNAEIREVIDTITSKVVLILGRFTEERKPVLDALRDELRKRNYLPILFDFDKPASRDLTETVSTLAHMARFVIADITEAKSIPQELMTIVPNLPSVPVQPLILPTFRSFNWRKDRFFHRVVPRGIK